MTDRVRATTYGFMTLLAGVRIDAIVRERCRHNRKIARRHQHRALAEIHVQNGANVTFNDGVVAEQISNCSIAIASLALGSKHRLISAQFVASKSTQRVEDAGKRFIASAFMNERRARNGAGIDHRVIGAVIGSQAYRIECVAARLDADNCFHFIGAEGLQSQRKDEWLGNGLDGEGDGAISDLIDVTVNRREAYSEVVRLCLFQFWNVIGHRSLVVVEKSAVAIGQKLMEGR